MTTKFVKQWSGTAASVRQALELAHARGQLVSFEPVRANGRGVAVRVVLRDLDRPTPTGPPTGPRQDPDRSSAEATQKPDRTTTRRALLIGASVGVGLGLVGVVVWVVFELVAWASGHVAAILGGAVALLIAAAVLARILVGGDSHPCNR